MDSPADIIYHFTSNRSPCCCEEEGCSSQSTLSEEPTVGHRLSSDGMTPGPPWLQGLRTSGACKNPKWYQMTPMEIHSILCGRRSIHSYLHSQQRCVGTDRATIKELYEQIYSHCVSILDVQALKPSCVFPSLV